MEKRERMYHLPISFSWVLNNKIAGMSFVQQEDIPALCQNITLTEYPLPFRVPLIAKDSFSNDYDLQNLHFPIVDHSVPNFQQVDEFITNCTKVIDEEKRGVVVHCAAGIGRTGVMLACFITIYCNMQAFQAVEFVRSKRGAIYTPEQEYFVDEYRQYRITNPTPQPYNPFQDLYFDNILIYSESLNLDKVVIEWQKMKNEKIEPPAHVVAAFRNLCKRLRKMDVFDSLCSK